MSPEQIIEKWVAAARAGADTNNLEVGVNISTLPAVRLDCQRSMSIRLQRTARPLT